MVVVCYHFFCYCVNGFVNNRIVQSVIELLKSFGGVCVFVHDNKFVRFVSFFDNNVAILLHLI